MFFNYLWDKIKRSVICRDYEKGGLRMVDVKMFMASLKLTWIRRILLNTNKYFTVIKELYPGITESIMFGNNYLEDRRIRINNGFWNDVVKVSKLLERLLNLRIGMTV